MSRMWRYLKSSRSRILVGTVALVACGFTVAANVDNRPVRERAKAWAITHQQALPRTLEELAAYPIDYQREIFSAMSPYDKSRLWRTKLHSMVDSGTLTPEQRAFVVRTIEVVTPEAFASATPPDLCPEIARLFPDKEHRGMFRALGGGVSPTFAWRPAVISLAERIQSKFIAQATETPCDCRGGGFCECGSTESCDSVACTATNDCGCFFLGPCDKVCEFAVQSPTPIRK